MAQGFNTVTTADDGWYRDMVSFAFHTSWLHKPAEFYTSASIVVLALGAVWMWWSARSRSDRVAMAAVAWLGFGSILAIGATYVIKNIVQEARPCQAIQVVTVQTCPGLNDYSFPSNHTAIAVALAAGIWLINRKWGIVAMVVAIVEGVSRVYLGQHYPHDVLAGFVLSCLVVFGLWPFVRKPLERLIERLAQTPLKVLLSA